MALDVSLINLVIDAAGDAIVSISLHSAAPVAGSNEVAGGGYARQTPIWSVPADGVISLAGALTFSTPANQPVTHVGLWSAGSVWRGSLPLAGDDSANAAGQYIVSDIELSAEPVP